MRSRIFFIVALCLIVSATQAFAQKKPVKTDPEIAKMVKEVSAKNIEATIRKLVSFGTRNTLSEQDNPTRGIRFGSPRNNHLHEADGTGMGPPVPEWVEVSQTLDRWFAFIDITGFTSYTEAHGTQAALEVLARFRSAVRQVTGRRGVRVLKWLGDGVMLVSTAPSPEKTTSVSSSKPRCLRSVSSAAIGRSVLPAWNLWFFSRSPWASQFASLCEPPE